LQNTHPEKNLIVTFRRAAI